MENLAQAVKTLQESLLFRQPLPENQKSQALQTIRSSFKQDNPYLGFFTASFDRKKGLQLIGGEKLHTKTGAFNVLGLEAVRLLRIFEDLQAQENILPEVERRVKSSCYGTACTMGECAHATVALWRYQAAGGLSDNGKLLEQQLKDLQTLRKTQGNWKGFPFYYTLNALTELQNPQAKEELMAAKETCLRRLKRYSKNDNPVSRQRKLILERALEKAAV